MARGNKLVEPTRKHLIGLKKVLAYFSTQMAIAESLGVTRQNVNAWFKGRVTIPESHARRLSAMLQNRVDFYELRPDCKIIDKNLKKELISLKD